MLAMGNVSNFKFYEITGAELAVDGQIEQSKISRVTAQL